MRAVSDVGQESPLDQVLTLSQSIWDGFQKKKPPDRTILASVDFSRAFDSVWHSALFHGLLSLRLPPCFVLWVRSFLSDRGAGIQVGGSRSRSFRIRHGVPRGSVLGPVLFILFVDGVTKDLPRGAYASLCADNLAVWSSSPDPLGASSVVRSSLAVLETWSNLWRLPLGPGGVGPPFSLRIPIGPLSNPDWFGPTLNSLEWPLVGLCPLGPVSNPCVPGSIHATEPFAQLPLPLGVPQKNLSPYSTKPLSVWCSHMPLLDGSHSSATNHLEVLHRAACRVITGCLSSTPSLLGARLPPLGLALEHRTLCSFGRALRLPPDFSSLCALAIRGVPCRLKKKPSWISFCSSATQPLPSPRESLITCPHFPPRSTACFTVSPFVPDCTGSGAARLQVVLFLVLFLQSGCLQLHS